MGFIDTFDIRIAIFEISHRSGGDSGARHRIVEASSVSAALEPDDYARFVMTYLYGINYSRPPTPLGELYEPNPNRRAGFQSISLGDAHLASLLGQGDRCPVTGV